MNQTGVKRSFKFKCTVVADAVRGVTEYRKSDAWLQRGIEFNHGFRLTPEHQNVVAELFQDLIKGQNVYKPNKKKQDFEILLANLLSQRRRPLSISLNSRDWVSSRYGRAGAFTIKLINVLHKRGLIDMKKGYYFPKKESRNTKIWATEKLLNYFPVYADAVIYDPVELVELRDKEGKLIDYQDTAETRRIRTILKQANQINQSATIKYGGYKLSAYLTAIFKNKFTLYGRLHTRGYRHYQGFSEEERGEITINGDPVVELDFSGLHPRLLYAKEGIQFNKDPYSMVHDDPMARPFLKSVLLFMLNAKDEVTAERAANYWLRKNHGERELLKKIGITRARPILDAFKEAHKPIAHYFCNGKDTGMRIMNLDSTIALEVVKHFAKQGKPILAIHDSFIVQRQYQRELRLVMNQTYSKHTGGFRCPIK
jgi:hypothetical protein